MATYVEINGKQYPAVITGRLNDKDWGNRESKAIEVEMTYAEAMELFVDDVAWNIIQDIEAMKEVENEDGELVMKHVTEQEVYDNSEYSIAGDVVDHRNGTVTVKMGKPTAEELLAIMDLALLDATYENLMGGNK
jgi:glycyl-tRNA synthetase alpha subunit